MAERPAEIARTITIERVAEHFQGLSPWTLRSWIRQGLLSHHKIGRRVPLDEEEVRALLARTYRPAQRPVEGNGAINGAVVPARPKKATPGRRAGRAR
jgi:hypothetical protein